MCLAPFAWIEIVFAFSVTSKFDFSPELYRFHLSEIFRKMILLFPEYIECDKSAISNAIYFARQNGTNETCFGAYRRERLLPGNRVSFLAENMNGLNVCDPVTAIGGTLVVLLSLMIYEGRPRKRTSLNPVLLRPYICVSCKIAHFTSTLRTPWTVKKESLFIFRRHRYLAFENPAFLFDKHWLRERRRIYNLSCIP